MRSFSSILFLLPFLTHNLVVVIATITIADTGARYPSEPDHWYSGHFIPGVNYMAHLQYLEHNLDVCPITTEKFSVKRPIDNFPVVLLARRNGCADWTKIQTVKQEIDPAGVVQFIIIYDTEDDEDDIIPVYPEKQQLAFSPIIETVFQKNKQTNKQTEAWLTTHLYDDNINMGVLHVSASIGNDLLRIILQESNYTREMGGTQLLLNGESSSNTERQYFLRKALFWFGISFLVSGCCCSFILSVRLQILNDDDETTVAPPRPTRRRLTFDQVEEWVPEFVYHIPNEETENKEETIRDPVECTVCLDPFQDGEYMRKLPCGHQFHSYCIAKWLVERSSTCPLCKLDLLPENIEDLDGSDDEEQENAVTTEEASIIEMMEVPEQSISDEEQEESTLTQILGRIWGRFRQTTHTGEEVGVDTTPLLSNNENSSSNIELERLSDDDNNTENV